MPLQNLSSENDPDNDVILISPPSIGGPNGPRSFIYNPFSAYHTSGYFIICSEDNIYGVVDVQIEKPDWSICESTFNTEDGIIYCPVEETEGQYTIRIITSQRYIFTGVYVN